MINIKVLITATLVKAKWYYEDEEGNEQGPFKTQKMCEWTLSGLGPEVGIEEYRKNLIGILREFHRECMHF
jgi:hypothetical protein